MSLDYAHAYSDRDSVANINTDSTATDADSYSVAIGDSERHSDRYTYPDTDANRHANPDCDSHRYTYRHAGPNHTQRAWLQSTGFADG